MMNKYVKLVEETIKESHEKEILDESVMEWIMSAGDVWLKYEAFDLLLGIGITLLSGVAIFSLTFWKRLKETIKVWKEIKKDKSVGDEIKKFIESSKTFSKVKDLVSDLRGLKGSEKEELKGLRGNKRKDALEVFKKKVKDFDSSVKTQKRELKKEIIESDLSNSAKLGLLDLIPGLKSIKI